MVRYAYSGSKLINEAILYFCELTISCKYESIPYLLYTRKTDMGEYTHQLYVYIIHVRFSLFSLISGNIYFSALTCSQIININHSQSSGAY